jgi:hypothetical protein
MARTNKAVAVVLALSSALAGCISDSNADVSQDTAALGSPVYPTAHPRIYLGPNKARLAAALNSNTPAASKFKTRVDSWYAGTTIWGFEAWNGALMSAVSGDAKYCVKSIAMVEAQVVAAETAIKAGAAPEVARDHYLHTGELIGDLAMVYDWCFSQVTAAQKTRWLAYANQTITNVWNPTTATWGAKAFPWTGWSVNNPSNNYFYSFLRGTMLLGLASRGENAQADAWLKKFRDEKVIGQVVPTFNADLVGGGSREGTGYGVAMRGLFELYDFWLASTGEQLATTSSHARMSLLANIHQTMPTLDKIAPTGDHARDRTAPFFDYQRHYFLELMTLFPNDHLAKRAKQLLADSNVPAMTQQFMAGKDFMYDNPSIVAQPLDGLNTTYYARGIGEVYARSGWDKGATWVNMIAGPYTESHAHQDQGSIMIYKGGWLAYDANVSSKSGLMQATTAHSLVRVDSGGAPVKQMATTTSKLQTLKKGSSYTYVSGDLTPAYKGNAAIQMVQRDMLYLQPNVVIVFDRVKSTAGTSQTWQLASPVAPTIAGAAATFTNAGHNLKVTRVAPSAASMSTYNFASSEAASYTGGFRLDETVAGGDNRYLHVMSVDGAVSSTANVGATGVTVNLAAGGQVTVNFNRDAAGATLTINGTTTTIGATVDVLAE